ncbi:MAG: Spy/CpxP family protein refolding chaperone [Pseudomonadota bacterium]
MSITVRSTLLALGFTTFGAIAAIGSQAIAGNGPGHGRGMGPGMGMGMGAGAEGFGPGAHLAALLEDLNLTEAQQAEAGALKVELRETFQAHRDDRDQDMEAAMQALQTTPVDAKAIHSLIDTRHARMAATAHDVADAVLDFYADLDASQRAVLLDRVQRAQERRERVREALAE